MNRLQVLFLVLLIGFVALVWLGTGRVTTPKVVESVSSVVQPLLQITPTTQITRIDQGLIIPVAGVRSDQLVDTFTASRAEGRTHDAIDIIAPADTPVLAAADGTITKLSQSERGGTTIYQLSADRKMIFYYAHLARYADGLTEGKQVRQGEVIAYVGDTGNAGPGNYHLHFSIAIVSDPKRYWEGTNINPYPLLHK
jgi:murein DD-endopeptidase MepM/ murein hydrolase activator NlpD